MRTSLYLSSEIVAVDAALAAWSPAGAAQERDRAKIPENTPGTSPTSIRARRPGEPRKSRPRPRFPGCSRSRARWRARRGRWPTRSTRCRRSIRTSRGCTPTRACLRSGHARRRAPGRAPGDAAARVGLQRAVVGHRAGSSVFPKGRVDAFIAAEPRLNIYRFYLQDIERRATHTLSEDEEKLLADAGPLASAPSEIYNILSNADFPYPSVTLSDGRTVKVDQAAYADCARCRTAPIASS